jgi:hypothetical protein
MGAWLYGNWESEWVGFEGRELRESFQNVFIGTGMKG